MARFFLLIGWVVILLEPLGVTASAQGPHAGHRMHSIPWAGKCDPLERLSLSAGQRDSVKQIDAQYKGRILAYRKDFMIKRIELRDLIRDSAASEDAVRRKSQELETAQHLLHNEMMDYQLRVRSILTPEQLGRWCTLVKEISSPGGRRGDAWFRLP